MRRLATKNKMTDLSKAIAESIAQQLLMQHCSPSTTPDIRARKE